MGVKIGVVTFPIGKAGVVPLSNLIKILLDQTDQDIHLLTGNEGVSCEGMDRRVKIINICHKPGKNTLSRFLHYLVTQVRSSIEMVRLHRHIDLWYFYIGGQLQLLQVMTAKLLGGKVLLSFPCMSSKDAVSQKVSYAPLIDLVTSVNCKIADRIVVASRELACVFSLTRYEDKLSFAHEYFFDCQRFQVIRDHDSRDNVIGFIGRLSEEKGILNLLEALPMIVEERDDVRCVIGGEGPLRERVHRFIVEQDMGRKVSAMGWIDHADLARCLNSFKLLVIPSYTEAGPIIAYEAMGCGTPILATRVGFVLDKVEDGRTGFILENNTPACIARQVLEALSSPEIGNISRNGRDLAVEQFSYEMARESFTSLMSRL